MTRQELDQLFEIMAARTEEAKELDKKDVFCMGIDPYNDIHIREERWPEVLELIQPVVIYNPNFDREGTLTEAHFTYNIHGVDYRVFALLAREGKR